MEQRVSLITLGVADLARARGFYEAMGWRAEATPEGIVAFNLLGQALGLYPKADLARDMGLDAGEIGGFSGITLAHNVRDKAEVAELYDRAVAAGGRGIKPPHDVFWGGHIAYVADPDGHVWELAFNPEAPLAEDGAFGWDGA